MATDEDKKAVYPNEPQRTCIGCRKVTDKKALIRYVVKDGALTRDSSGVLAGRGAYLCRDTACIKDALKKKDAFSKALRTRVVVPDVKGLLAELTVSRVD